jgi:hypothetical protein
MYKDDMYPLNICFSYVYPPNRRTSCDRNPSQIHKKYLRMRANEEPCDGRPGLQILKTI